jgi:NAD-dependent deacetylase
MSESAAPIPDEVVELVRNARAITVFTGAGMSAESGIATFRGSGDDSLWGQFDPMMLASVDGWEADRALVWGWYAWRMGQLSGVEPNAGHHALAALADGRTVEVVTQNVDDLHERAGSTVVSHLHGNLVATRCSVCRAPYDGLVTTPHAPELRSRAADRGRATTIAAREDADDLDALRVEPPVCASCGGAVRPGVVWFGEMLPERDWDNAVESFTRTDLVLVIGTSGIVYPAAGLPEVAAARGVPIIEVNPDPSGVGTITIRSTAATALPALVAAL